MNGNTRITSYADFLISAAMSGPGGFTQIGNYGGFGLVNSGQVTLSGTNTYTGPTIVRRGTLRVLKAASLYNGDSSRWTPANVTVSPTATLRLCVGGPGEFTGEQTAAFLKNLTMAVNNNGLMERAVFCLDTSNAKEPVVVTKADFFREEQRALKPGQLGLFDGLANGAIQAPSARKLKGKSGG